MKNRLIIEITAVIFMLILNPGCGGGNIAREADNIEIKITELNSWINLMPGSEPTFHVSGRGIIANGMEAAIDSAGMDKIIIMQGTEAIYSIEPVFELTDAAAEVIEPDESKEFKFGSRRGLAVKEQLIADDSIEVIIRVKAGRFLINKHTSKIKVEKVY